MYLTDVSIFYIVNPCENTKGAQNENLTLQFNFVIVKLVYAWFNIY